MKTAIDDLGLCRTAKDNIKALDGVANRAQDAQSMRNTLCGTDNAGRVAYAHRSLEQRYLVLGKRLSACITDVIGSVNVPDINKAISYSLLIIMVTCTKVHVACCHEILRTELVSLLVVCEHLCRRADKRAQANLLHQLAKPHQLFHTVMQEAEEPKCMLA